MCYLCAQNDCLKTNNEKDYTQKDLDDMSLSCQQ